MDKFTQPVQELIRRYRKYLDDETPRGEPVIQVDEIASKVAVFYEKIRSIIDYQEGHLLRKNVIARALQRRIFLKEVNGEEIAEPLIREVIRSGYLKNDSVSESKISEVQEIVVFVLNIFGAIGDDKHGGDLKGWLLGICVCAIEEALINPEREIMLADTMFWIMSEKLSLSGADLHGADADTLLFTAIHKSLFKVDEDRLNYRLLTFLFPKWNEFEEGGPGTAAERLDEARIKIRKYAKHELLPFFLKLCNKQRVVFYALGDLIFKGKDLSLFDEAVKEVYEERYEKEKGRLFKLAFFTVLSFFVSKVLVAIAIEVPIDVYFTGNFSLFHVIANVIFPPVLMFLILLSIRLPSDKNLGLVTEGVRGVMFGDDKVYGIIVPRKKSRVVIFTVKTVYAFLFLLLLYYFSLFLLDLGFSVANVIVFILFTSIVTATGVKVYNRSKELSLEKEKTSFLLFVLDLVTLPLVTLGRWVVAGLRHFNVLVILFNLVIELPFQLFVEFLENFHSFMKSRKDEIE